jgi:SAM-dependent methyltransferase
MRKYYINLYTIAYRIKSRTIRFFKSHVTHDSIFFDDEALWMCGFAHTKKVSNVLQKYSPKSVLDIGCGLGNTVKEFRCQGLEAFGLEGSELAIRKSEVADFIKQANLNYPVDLKRKFDLVWCVEVLEHIHPKYVQNIVGTICRNGDNLLISAAPPGQHGELHFNEQPQEYWVEKFRCEGFSLDEKMTSEFQKIDEEFSQNVMFFKRNQ